MAITSPANAEPLIKNEETMRYRPLGNTGLQVSALALGCMRLSDDQDANTELVAAAVDKGVNYFETTRFYCGGQCQHRTAPGLKGKTKGVIVSGKAGINADTTAHSFRKEIELQLEILGLDHFKFFQVGWFGWDRVGHLLKRGGVLDALRRAQDEGLVHHIGFTGHDQPENFIKVIETGLFDSLTVPYSLINRKYEPTIKRAGELGVGVIAMCPVAGGVLSNASNELQEALGTDRSMPELALRFVLSNPDVSAACSGMSSMQMLEENVRTAKEFDPESDADFEKTCAIIDGLAAELDDKICTTCGYCRPCPQGVNIVRYMDVYTTWKAFGYEDWAKGVYEKIKDEQSAGRCNECGGCEERCPNDLPIIERLREIRALLR